MAKKRKWRCLSVLTFFSLTPKQASVYRNNLFRTIHDIVFHGKGGYDFHTIYNMPIWLRNFTYSSIDKFYKEQNEENSKSSVEESIANMKAAGAVAPKNKSTTQGYVTKASKK